MEKLAMCRICLAEDVLLYKVVNKNLHQLYEKLTEIPFITEDSRPMLACFYCCTKMKQCAQFQRKCLEAEELLVRMLMEDYKPTPSHLKIFGGFIRSPMVHVSIDDECQTKSDAIKEEVPVAYETQDDVNEPKEELQNDELEQENLHNSYSDVEDIPQRHSEADSEDDSSLMEFKIEEEVQEVPMKKQITMIIKRVPVVKIQKLDLRRIKLEDTITDKQKKNELSDSNIIENTQSRTATHATKFKEPVKCDQRSLNQDKNLERIYTRTDGKSLNCEKPYKCHICQRSYGCKRILKRHIRIHDRQRPYECHICQRSFTCKSVLNRHIRIHTGEKPYKCDICLHSFHDKGNFVKHIRKHTGEKPYKCDICQLSFSLKFGLTRHIRVHTGEKPYKCDICLYSSNEKSKIVKHMRHHSGEKAYKCDICQLGFSHKFVLTRHNRIHTGEKPFKCDIPTLA